MRVRYLLTVTVALLISTQALVSAQDDPLQERLDRAIDAYNKAVQDETTRLKEAIQKKIEDAQKKGDLDLKETYGKEQEKLDRGDMPTEASLTNSINTAVNGLKRAKSKLLAEFLDVQKQYVKNGDDDRAKATREERDQLDQSLPEQAKIVPASRAKKEAKANPLVFLSDLQEKQVKVVHLGFGKGRIGKKGIRSIVDGKDSPHGLSMHPGDGPAGGCFVLYDLPPGAQLFTATATLDEGAKPVHCKIQFEIAANGKVIWTSGVICDKNLSEQCQILLPADTRSLELRTRSAGNAHSGHAVWIDPAIQIAPASLKKWEALLGQKAGR